MIDEARPEIVAIATPPVTHHAIVLRAFAAGAHVLCEKPLAMSRAEAQAMVDAAVRAGRIGMTAFNWRFPAAMQQFHGTVREGVVGRVFNLAARWLGSRLADEKAAPSWRQDRAQAGHGAMGDMGVHVIDLIRWNFGEFARPAVGESRRRRLAGGDAALDAAARGRRGRSERRHGQGADRAARRAPAARNPNGPDAVTLAPRRASRPGRARCRARIVGASRVGQGRRVSGHQIR